MLRNVLRMLGPDQRLEAGETGRMSLKPSETEGGRLHNSSCDILSEVRDPQRENEPTG